MTFDPIKLEIFKNLFAAIAEEMGTVLRKSSYSPNIKERRDFSCAVFDSHKQMIAQAAHIPVHLGSMPLSIQFAMQQYENDIYPGDIIILNDPYQGGTHLPDITLISPVFLASPKEDRKISVIIGFVASRAHHSDIGGITPGSMPLARDIFQEGLIIPPVKIVEKGKMNQGLLGLILSNVRTPEERQGDLLAQIAANQRGAFRLTELFSRYGQAEARQAMTQLLAYSEFMTRKLIESLPNGVYTYKDVLDDNGISSEPIPICVKIIIKDDSIKVDFTGSAAQQPGGINAVYAITLSAVSYVFRCLLGMDVPNNAGCLAPIEVIAPQGTVVNALSPAPVAGGNVETSQRIVDVLLGALSTACPEKIPAASQGTMNNISIGGLFPDGLGEKINSVKQFAYYETIGGGTGASINADGLSAIHSHMTNTLNTPIEALEYVYPLRVQKYSIRKDSGGKGLHQGGDGIIREIEILTDCQVTLLSERRKFPPYGLAGGGSGECGENIFIRKGVEFPLPSKGTVLLKAGDIIIIRTPGGGAYGVKSD